jgi:hypothetical protein
MMYLPGPVSGPNFAREVGYLDDVGTRLIFLQITSENSNMMPGTSNKRTVRPHSLHSV